MNTFYVFFKCTSEVPALKVKNQLASYTVCSEEQHSQCTHKNMYHKQEGTHSNLIKIQVYWYLIAFIFMVNFVFYLKFTSWELRRDYKAKPLSISVILVVRNGAVTKE